MEAGTPVRLAYLIINTVGNCLIGWLVFYVILLDLMRLMLELQGATTFCVIDTICFHL